MSKDEEKNEIHIGDWVVSLKYPTECFIKFRSGIFKPDLELKLRSENRTGQESFGSGQSLALVLE